MSRRRPTPPAEFAPAAIAAYVAGVPGAADRLAAALEPHARKAARLVIGPGSPDLDDVTQDSVVAVLEHIRKRGGFEGDLLSFTITVARNRCRTLLDWQRHRRHRPVEPLAEWIAHPERSVLEMLVDREALELLQRALDDLDPPCRELLRACFLDRVSMEELRRRSGLTTVQGVHYRKGVCLRRLSDFFRKRLFDRSLPDRDGARGDG